MTTRGLKETDGHCDLCHVGTPDVYADGCCCCVVHRKHGGEFTDKTVLRGEKMRSD